MSKKIKKTPEDGNERAYRKTPTGMEIPIAFKTEEEVREIEDFFNGHNPRVLIGFPTNHQKLMVIKFETRQYEQSSIR